MVYLLSKGANVMTGQKSKKGDNVMKRIAAIGIIGMFLLAGGYSQLSIAASASADGEAMSYGAHGAKQETNLTVEKMLVYALQDEYLARATYRAVIEKLGAQQPFSNIIKAEEQHIGILKDVFGARKLSVPKDTAASYISAPATLQESYAMGVKAEVDNIAMYDDFLKRELPADVKSAFVRLRDASKGHLAAFEKNLARKR